MRSLTRRGFTLAELLVTLTMIAALSIALGTMISGLAHAARRAAVSLVETRTVVTLGNVLHSELHDAAAIDVTQPAAATLAFNRQVGSGPICRSDLQTIWVSKNEWWATRNADPAHDQIMLLPATADAPWINARITSFTSAACPDGRAGWKIGIDQVIPVAGYARVGEPVKLNVYKSGGSDWYGFAPGDGSSSVQPFAGPLAPGTALPQLTTLHVIMQGKLVSGAGFSLAFPLGVP